MLLIIAAFILKSKGSKGHVPIGGHEMIGKKGNKFCYTKLKPVFSHLSVFV